VQAFWAMKVYFGMHTNAAVCAPAFIKLAEIRQSSRRTGSEPSTQQIRFACAAIAIVIISKISA
jgi:hypothetical protein